MRRLLTVALAAALLAAPSAAALDRDQARALVRVAVKLSGLKAREQVRIVIERPAPFRQRRAKLLDHRYPRVSQNYDETVYRALGLVAGGKGVLRKTLIETESRTGVYDPLSRTAYVQSGATERATALHEIVHALQDQHFDLRRVTRLPGGGDAMIAAAAAIEGHATLVTDVRATGKPSRATGKLTRFVELRRGFTYSVGLRFAADLRNLGGQQAVLSSLRRFPATSEQVFHLDKYFEGERAVPIVLPVNAGGATLASHGTFGELDVRALLAVFGVPRLDRVGSGWGGGRTGLYRSATGDATVIALDWDTAVDAAEWVAAVGTYVDEAFDKASPGPPAPAACGATACWQIGKRAIAFDRVGARTTLVLGADLAQADLLARTLLGKL